MEDDKENIEESKDKRKSNKYLELAVYIVFILICVFIIPKYVIQRTIVSGTSMEPTLISKDNLLVEKVSYYFSDPKRFDVVVFYPQGEESSEYYVKRVIGLPGETIQIIGSEIFINGKILKEDYGKDPISYVGIAKEPLQLEKDEYFLMGDNRKISFDSRYKDIGPIRDKYIVGKAVLRIWPLNKFGVFD
jgi:signal peptidase I